MSISEYNAHLKYRDSNGDTTIIYPVTKVKNIEGALPVVSGGTGAIDAATALTNLGLAPAFVYSVDNIKPGDVSNKADGTMVFVYTTMDDIWERVKSVLITVDGVWRLVWDMLCYAVTVDPDSSNVESATSNPTIIASNSTVEMNFTAETGYVLPDADDIIVTGATISTWDKATGTLILTEITGDVTVKIVAEKPTYSVTTILTEVTGESSNLTAISYGGTVSLTFIADEGYELPDAIDVDGATYVWDSKSGLLVLSEPTGNVSVVITGIESDTLVPSTIIGNYIMFLSDSSGFTIQATNAKWDGTIEYSFDKQSWSTWDGSSINSTSDNKIYMRGSDNTGFYKSGGMQLILSKPTGCYGNLNMLLDYSNPPTSVGEMCFADMFFGCTNLTHAPELPATTLTGEGSYQRMFYGCTSLTQPPELPATVLGRNSYINMFYGCTGIKLSATQTGEYQTAYRIPTTGIGVTATDAMKYMFTNTGGTFAGTPSLNTTYYGAWRN